MNGPSSSTNTQSSQTVQSAQSLATTQSEQTTQFIGEAAGPLEKKVINIEGIESQIKAMFVSNMFQKFVQTFLKDNICLRGYCGVINIEAALCKYILEYFKVNINVYPFYSPNFNCFIKRGCICSENCDKAIKCKEDPSRHCGGHHIIIFSNNNSLQIDDSDYVLDFTYKQMLYSRDTYNTKNKQLEIGNLPPYLFLSVPQYKNIYAPNDRWYNNITTMCFVIMKEACGIKISTGGKKSKKTKKRKNHKKHTKKRRIS